MALTFLTRLWNSGATSQRLKSALRPLARTLVNTAAAPPFYDSAREPEKRRGPLIVSGFLRERFGIARAGRLTASALEDAGFPVIRHDVRALLDTSSFRTGPPLADGQGGVWILHCNPPEAAAVLTRLPPATWRQRYRIGYWAWELPRAPRQWIDFARMLHEVWVPSRYVAEGLRDLGDKVRVMPHPVSAPSAMAETLPFAIPDRDVIFLAMADFRSSATRKNPMGAIEAYLRAMPEPSMRAGLVVKLSNAAECEHRHAELLALCDSRPDIAVSSDVLTDAEMARLVADIDVYLSLHRAEGFALGPAEAFAMGKGAIATGFSGNMDFMEGMDAALVRWTPAPSVDPDGVYTMRDQVWADPDLDDAADKIRRFADDALLRASIAAEGQNRVGRMRARWARAQFAAHPIEALVA